MTDQEAWLEPCPFCGNGGDQLWESVNIIGNNGVAYSQAHIECGLCGACGPTTALYPTSVGALESLRKMLNDEGWNTRIQRAALSRDGGDA